MPAKIFFLKTQIQFMYQLPCRISFFLRWDRYEIYLVHLPKTTLGQNPIYAPFTFPAHRYPTRQILVPGWQGLLEITNLKSILKGIKITDTFKIDCVS